MKKFFTSMASAIREILSDEKNRLSSKRIIGMMCAIFLCVSLTQHKVVYVEYVEQIYEPSKVLVETLGVITLGCLGLTSLDKYTNKKKKDNTDNENTII